MSHSGGVEPVSTATGPAGMVFPRLVEPGTRAAPELGTSLITVDRVGKSFTAAGGREITAVSGVSLELAPGRATLIRGPSGCGKTTLLSVVGCMVRPTEGRVRVAGRETTRLPEDELAELRRRIFGFVFQNHQLIRGLSAWRNVMVPVLPRADLNGFDLRARSLLHRLGLDGRVDLPVERLSGGEQQRVAIARALVNDPLAVIADEPTAQLDSEAALAFVELVAELRRQGRVVLVASHDPVLCDEGCFDRVVRLRDGRVVDEEA